MKKITFLIAGIIICASFNKPAVLLTDYRDAYVGRYFCNHNCQGLNQDHSSIVINNDTTTIAVSKDALDSILDITYGTTVFQVKLISSDLYPYPAEAHSGGNFFSTDSILFGSSIGQAPNICTYRGKKR